DTGPQIIAVIVLDVAVHQSGEEPLAVTVEGSPRHHSGDDRFGAGVLAGQGEYRGPRLLVEVVQVAAHRAEREADLGIGVEHRNENPRGFLGLRRGRRATGRQGYPGEQCVDRENLCGFVQVSSPLQSTILLAAARMSDEHVVGYWTLVQSVMN